jgi:UrcA family protein
MKNATLAKSIIVAGVLALGCTAVDAKPLADRPLDSDSPAERLTFTVGFSDLDLTKIKGAKILYLRILYAATTLCQNDYSWSKHDGDVCTHKAIDAAVARVNSPLLSQYYRLRRNGDKVGLAQLARVDLR